MRKKEKEKREEKSIEA